MKITVAKTAGFCMGVRRAVDMVLDASNRHDSPIFTYGPLIHNPQVLELLENKQIKRLDRIPEKGDGIVLIRAHGVPPEDEAALQAAGFTLINATCPRVMSVQNIIKKYADRGYATIIIGDKNHAEVIGLLGYARGNGHTVSTMDELERLDIFSRAVVVAQTTQNMVFFEKVRSYLKNNAPHYNVFNTICGSTEKRQNEVRKIADEHDAVVVIGGRQSGNTRRLAQIAGECGKRAWHVEDIDDLDLGILSDMNSIAITAGASTPNWIIKKAFLKIQRRFERNRPFLGVLYRLRDFLLVSNLLLSAGAGCLTFACSEIQGFSRQTVYGMVAMLYILSMQIINNLFAVKSDQYNNPERAEFYQAHRKTLSALVVVSGGGGLALAYSIDLFSFFLLLIMSVLGLSYNLKVIPWPGAGSRLKRIKDIPGSKTVLIAIAWGTVTSLLPACCSSGNPPATVVAFVFSTGLVFARTAFFDILEIQGDRIAGKETLPILLGESRSYLLIKIVLISIFFILILSAGVKIISSTGFLLALLPLFMFYLIRFYKKGDWVSGRHLEFIMECHFVLAGLMSIGI